MKNEKNFILIKIQYDKRDKHFGTLLVENTVQKIKELMEEKLKHKTIFSYSLYKHVSGDKYELIEDETKEVSI